MSTLYVNNIDAESGTNITIPTGRVLTAPGHVIQVTESGTFTDSVISTSGTWGDTDLVVNITPNNSSNKILILGSPVVLLVGTGGILRGSLRVMRSINGGTATNIWNTDSFVEHFQVRDAANEHNTIGSITILDTPNTTDPVSYRVQAYYQGDSGSTSIRLWGSGRGSKMIAQEIAQ